MIKLVVFDMAGTTIDEDNVVYKTLRKAINKEGYDFSLEKVLEHGAGKEKLQAIKDIIALEKALVDILKEADKIYNVFSNLLKMNYEKLDVKTYEGTVNVFQELKNQNIRVILNTGYNRKTASSLLAKLYWEQGVHYDLLVTADDVIKSRPHPDMILKAMQHYYVDDPSEVVKVGDSIIDIEEGQNAKCGITFGVTTGAHTKEQLASANPSYIINSLTEILEYL